MSKAKHTPGKWKVDSVWGLIIGENGEEIAAIHPAGESESNRVTLGTARANAVLIAAAPDLLAACYALRAELRIYEDTPKSDMLKAGFAHTMRVTNDAIAKAQGGAA